MQQHGMNVKKKEKKWPIRRFNGAKNFHISSEKKIYEVLKVRQKFYYYYYYYYSYYFAALFIVYSRNSLY